MIIVNQLHVVDRCGTRTCHFSPHDFVRALLRVSKPRRKPLIVRSRCLSRMNLSAFHIDLQYTDWSGVFTAQDVSDQWCAFTRELKPIIDRHAPMRNVTIRNLSAPKVTEATRDLMGRRRYVLRQQGHQSVEYRELNRAVRSAIRADCRDSISQRIQESGPNAVWRCLRGVVGSKKSGSRTLPTVSADELNQFFVNVGPRVCCRGCRPGACSRYALPPTQGWRLLVSCVPCKLIFCGAPYMICVAHLPVATTACVRVY